jgi:type IV pilus assembly protein PilV
MINRFHNSPLSRAQGFTLIEVAVALMVLAVGLLGIAGMQSSGMKASHQSHLRAVAMTQAQDLADRIRANLNGLRTTNYTNGIPTAAPSPNCQTSANTCSGAQLALSDLYNWQTQNAAVLPSGQGAIACNDINAPNTPNILEAGTDCIITVRWDGERNGATGTGCTGANTDLTCLRMRITP